MMKNYYCNQKCFIITGKDLKYLTAILNSKLFRYYFRNNFPELLGGTRELSKIYFEQIPILRLNPEAQAEFVQLMDTLSQIKTKESTEFAAKEKILNDLVYRLYGLTEDEILAIEQSEV